MNGEGAPEERESCSSLEALMEADPLGEQLTPNGEATTSDDFAESPMKEVDNSELPIEEEEQGEEKTEESVGNGGSQVQMAAPTRNLNRIITADVTHKVVQPGDVIDYEWPPKSGDKWFLQEQIGELLDIKSFSRKFPDLTRRKVTIEERDFLISIFRVNDLLNETQLRDLTAMRSVEILDLMANDYAPIYQEYKKATSAREKALMAEKAKEMEAIRNDSKKLAELREKSMKSAMEFNKEMQQARRVERKQFWDIQTNILQSRATFWKKMKPEATRPHPYSCALVQGQFQNYYRKYSRDELLRLPLSTIVDGEHLYPVERDRSPPPIHLTEKDVAAAGGASEGAGITVKQELMAMMTPKTEVVRKSSTTTLTKVSTCEICSETDEEPFISCAACGANSHTDCLEMTDEMLEVVKTYAWNCVDCRKCTLCHKPDKEEHIMFCDRCDRGYHTFCVGVKEAPQGKWICTTHCNVPEKKTPTRPIRNSMSRRGSAVVLQK
ncbi:unnamed protein product [Caenorhabditis auriculariae]|uniref:PHD-type domain-containing protein n=1 Tax=Caenorhabditis auriculariae TaxID=2777116 RepID=A0A8S1GVQ5_9PELO|nr:unnamed protein product [Caenorhabditis auriculariae]